MHSMLSRRVAPILVVALSIGLALNGAAHALDEAQPGSKSCMSDAQVRAFMADVLVTMFPRQAEVCQTVAPSLGDALVATRSAFEESTRSIATQLESEVKAIFVPAYGEEAGQIRGAALDAAITPSLDYARQNWNTENCSAYVQNVGALTKEVNGADLGPTMTGMIDASYDAERAVIPRCPG